MKKRRIKKDKFAYALNIASSVVLVLDLAYVVFAAVEIALTSGGERFISAAFKPLTVTAIVVNVCLMLSFAVYFIYRKIKRDRVRENARRNANPEKLNDKYNSRDDVSK